MAVLAVLLCSLGGRSVPKYFPAMGAFMSKSTSSNRQVHYVFVHYIEPGCILLTPFPCKLADYLHMPPGDTVLRLLVRCRGSSAPQSWLVYSVTQLVAYWCRAIADHLLPAPQLMWEKTLGFKQTQARSHSPLCSHATPGAGQAMAGLRASQCPQLLASVLRRRCWGGL